MKEEILGFMNKHPYCTISTVGPDSKPESAFVGFSNNSKPVIVIGTSNKTRKFYNIQKNPSVAVVIADEIAEIQYEGEAYEVSEKELNVTEERHFRKLPGAEKYRGDPTQTYIRIEPTWLRYIKHDDDEEDIIEEFTEFT